MSDALTAEQLRTIQVADGLYMPREMHRRLRDVYEQRYWPESISRLALRLRARGWAVHYSGPLRHV